jgi:hypothetical protein
VIKTEKITIYEWNIKGKLANLLVLGGMEIWRGGTPPSDQWNYFAGDRCKKTFSDRKKTFSFKLNRTESGTGGEEDKTPKSLVTLNRQDISSYV